MNFFIVRLSLILSSIVLWLQEMDGFTFRCQFENKTVPSIKSIQRALARFLFVFIGVVNGLVVI